MQGGEIYVTASNIIPSGQHEVKADEDGGVPPRVRQEGSSGQHADLPHLRLQFQEVQEKPLQDHPSFQCRPHLIRSLVRFVCTSCSFLRSVLLGMLICTSTRISLTLPCM